MFNTPNDTHQDDFTKFVIFTSHTYGVGERALGHRENRVKQRFLVVESPIDPHIARMIDDGALDA